MVRGFSEGEGPTTPPTPHATQSARHAFLSRGFYFAPGVAAEGSVRNLVLSFY